MNIEDLQAICRRPKRSSEDLRWETHLCFNAGKKMFLITSPDEKPYTASFKVSDETFNNLCERDGFMPAPCLARHKWGHVDDINRLSKKQREVYITQAYKLTGSKLPAKLKKQPEL
ncbi:MAG: MmcQ/YjbR family DNA-binding protein [Bacteroidetes bacterium]|nr:MmcQ/YjbR family DNA-binding protein [Bacteroidota bacterium]